MFRLTPASEEQILRNYEQSGYGYADYRDGLEGLGISVTSHSRIAEMAKSSGLLKEALYLENGWHNFQDVHAYTKSSV